MTGENRTPRIAQRVLRIAPWAVSLATTIVGVSLLLARTTVIWEESSNEPGMWDAAQIDVTGIGLALLCVGILSLMATLLTEAHVRPHAVLDSMSTAPTAPSAESGGA